MSSELVPAHRSFVVSSRRLLRRARARAGVGVAVASAAFVASGCYDSQWGEQERAQRRLAAHEAPHALAAPSRDDEGAGAHAVAPAAHVLRARVYVTPTYAAQTLDSARQLRDLVSDANAILASAVGARVEIEGTTAWSPPVAEDSLVTVLNALREKDAAEGVDLVIGLIGGMSSASQSFHELGMAPINGKHLLVRAASNLDEHDAVESAFTELEGDERARLRRDLKRHRATAVFLHEVGHTLGAIHETDPRSVMHFQYARGMAGFSREAATLMRLALAHRGPSMRAEHPDDEPAWAHEVRAYLREVPSSVWAEKDRAEMMARIDYVLAVAKQKEEAALQAAQVPAESVVPAAAAPSATPRIPRLRDADARIYERAVALEATRATDEAWTVARPLFAAYPDVYEVQDLRCKLAMKRPLGWTETRVECDPLMRLSVGVGRK